MLSECFDSVKAKKAHDSSVDRLIEHLATWQGGRDFESALNDDVLGPIVVFLYAGMQHRQRNVPHLVLRNFDRKRLDAVFSSLWEERNPGRKSMKPKEESLRQLASLAFDNFATPFGTFVEGRSKGKAIGWLRRESMRMSRDVPFAINQDLLRKLQENKQLKDSERSLLRFHQCLLVGERSCDKLLLHSWGLKERSLRHEREAIRKAIREKKQKQPREKNQGLVSPSFCSPAYKKLKEWRPLSGRRMRQPVKLNDDRLPENEFAVPVTLFSDSPSSRGNQKQSNSTGDSRQLNPGNSDLTPSTGPRSESATNNILLGSASPPTTMDTKPPEEGVSFTNLESMSTPTRPPVPKVVDPFAVVRVEAKPSKTQSQTPFLKDSEPYTVDSWCRRSTFDVAKKKAPSSTFVLPVSKGSDAFAMAQKELQLTFSKGVDPFAVKQMKASSKLLSLSKGIDPFAVLQKGASTRFDSKNLDVFSAGQKEAPLSTVSLSIGTDDSVDGPAIVTPTEEDDKDTNSLEYDSLPVPDESSVNSSPSNSQRFEKFQALLKKPEKPYQAKVLLNSIKNGKSTIFVEVPRSKSTHQWLANVRRHGWLEEALSRSVGDTMDTDDAACCAILSIARKHPAAFEEAGRKLGYWNFVKGPMDVYEAAGMWNQANVTKNAQRVIRRCISAYTGMQITPAEKKIDALVSHIVPPTHGIAKVGAQKISFWYKNVDDVLINLFENEFNTTTFHRTSVIFGGDHGQGVFGAAIKVILWDHESNIVAVAVRKVGHIDCTKDTYEILKATIADKLNTSLKRMKNKVLRLTSEDGDRVAFLEEEEQRIGDDAASLDEDTDDETASIEKGILSGSTSHQDSDAIANGSVYSHDSGSDGEASSHDGSSFLREGTRQPSSHDVELLSVGDLAYVSTALGKVNMGGNWCYLCDLSPTEWATIDHPKGEVWTLSRMSRTLSKIDNKELQDTPSNRKGCVESALFDCFQPIDYIPPCLHIMMGAFNDALKMLLKYVDVRFEKVSIEELGKRDAFWEASAAYLNAQATCDILASAQNERIADLKSQIESLKQKKSLKMTTGSKQRYLHTQFQKRDFSNQIKVLNQSIANIKTEEKQRKEDLLEKKTARDNAKKALDEERNKRKTVDNAIRQSIEQLLMKHGVDRGASHGGELTGVACLVLEEEIDVLMDEIRVLLKAVEGSDVSEEEVDEQMDSYEIHFLLLSRLFSLARTPKREMKDPNVKREVLKELRKTIKIVNKSTQRLGLSMKTVKRHICDDHLVGFIDTHDGIAEYLEDWLEQIHQTYKKNKNAKIRDKVVKGMYESKQEAIGQNIKVKQAGEELMKKTARSFKTARNDRRPAAALRQEARRARRDDSMQRADDLFASKPVLLDPVALNRGLRNLTEP